jgi:hypothetical protein
MDVLMAFLPFVPDEFAGFDVVRETFACVGKTARFAHPRRGMFGGQLHLHATQAG